MKLQSFILPGGVCEEKEVFFRSEGSVEMGGDGSLYMGSRSCFSSDTYMNLFDATLWKRYTVVSDVYLKIELRGCGEIEVRQWLDGTENCVYSGSYCLLQKNSVEIPLDMAQEGMFFFTVRAEKETCVYNACFETHTVPGDVRLTLIICTFQRKRLVSESVDKLLKSEFFDPGSSRYRKMFIRIIDNASELPLWKREGLEVHHNQNNGGAGGFARGILEARKAAGSFPGTHIVFMDDDAAFIPETFYRIHSLLSFITPETGDQVLAGRMFCLNDRKVQYTASEIWNGGNIIHLGYEQDMCRRENLLKMNEQRGEYSGWWLAVFPYSFAAVNLPLPLFLHCDDVEYGLRKGGRPIVMNGIQVWHETSEYRRSPVTAYYDLRNSLIVNAMYEDGSCMKMCVEKWKRAVKEARIEGETLLEYMLLKGMEDFLSGKVLTGKLDGEKKHRRLSRKTAVAVENSLLRHKVRFETAGKLERMLRKNENNRRKREKMQEKPYVSIIVPVYNVEQFLEECLDSVVQQSLRNIEIICVNDGSTDQSLNILEKYAETDNRIKIISKPNSGYGDSMNVGMEAAEGEYIGIVESDDFVEKNMFERLYQAALRFEADIVKSNHYIFSTKEGKKQKQFQAVCPQAFYDKVLNAGTCGEIFDFCMMNWSGIYKREFIEKNHIRHNITPGASFQDNGFWFQTLCQAERIVFINETFYYYRQDNPNSSINRKEKVFCICDEYSYIQKFVEQNPAVKQKYYLNFIHKKVFNYLHFYNLTSDEFKLAFLRRAAKEFEQDLKNPFIDKTQMNPWVMTMMNRIIDSPELFYYEDSVWQLNEKSKMVHQRLLEIRSSREFTRGLRIKKILHI